MPNNSAPMGRMARVAVVVKTISFLVTPNWCASVSKRKTTTKKSNASSVQPRNPARTEWWFALPGALPAEKFAMRDAQNYCMKGTEKKPGPLGGAARVGVQPEGG